MRIENREFSFELNILFILCVSSPPFPEVDGYLGNTIWYCWVDTYLSQEQSDDLLFFRWALNVADKPPRFCHSTMNCKISPNFYRSCDKMPNAELLWCEIPNVSRPSGQQLPILNRTHRSGYCHVFKLEKERLGWVYAKKVYFHRYKSQNIETLIARITENT